MEEKQKKDEECMRCALAKRLGHASCADARLHVVAKLRETSQSLLNEFAEKLDAVRKDGASQEELKDLSDVVQIFMTEVHLAMAAKTSISTGDTVGDFVKNAADTWNSVREAPAREAISQFLTQINNTVVKNAAEQNSPNN